MRYLANLGREIEDRRNWPAFALAGALVFLGSQLLKTWGWDNGVMMTALVAASGFLAYGLVRGFGQQRETGD